MANIKIPKKQFEKEIGKIDSKMQEKISLFGTPLESITNEEIEIEIFPNRPDLLSYQGFKREFLNFLGKSKSLKKYKLEKPQKDYVVKIDSSLKEIRPYTACAIVKGLKLNEERIKEIINLQEKLHITIGRNRKKAAIGIYPMEKIKFPITFTARQPDKIKFVPLESPGKREMSGLQILQRHQTGRNYAHLLAGKEKFPIFIDANNSILSMPPIINSHLTGKITEKTRDVFIECSGFDFATLKKCLNIIVTTLSEIGGKIYQIKLKGLLKETTPNLDTIKTKISIERTNKLLGLKLNEKDIIKLLKKTGHEYNPKTREVKSPAWRNDILHEVDLIEDIAIAYGYENLIPQIPEVATIGKSDKKENLKKKISEILVGLKFLEVSNHHLTTEKQQIQKANLEEQEQNKIVHIESSKTEYSYLRKDLSHYLLKNISENSDAEYPQKIFETGKVFELDRTSNKIIEKEKLAIAITPGNYTQIKQIINYLFQMLDKEVILQEPRNNEKIPKYLIQERTAEILINNQLAGYLGEISPSFLKNWKIKSPVSLLEISLKNFE
ncbi:MAG: phenylalanine--tRNA ligase subunit beta [Nanoarchaeota archaeon]